MGPIVYREMISGEEQAVCDFVKQVFNELVAPDYAREGVEEFFRFVDASAIAERNCRDRAWNALHPYGTAA